MNRIWLLALFFSAAPLISPDFARAADRKAERSAPAVDYPLGIVAFASVERVRARVETLAEVVGQAGAGETLLAGMMGDDDDIPKILNSPGLDTTRPIGLMSYPNWFGSDKPQAGAEVPDFDLDGMFDDPLDLLVGGASNIFTENATVVFCIPCKDRNLLLETIRGVLEDDGESLQDAEGQPGWYQLGEEGDVRVGFVYKYLLLVIDDGEVKHFDRNYPDFGSLARSSLGKNGFVYALYRKGLPALVRDVMAPAFKMAFAARFQQQDEESDIAFRLRTMSSSLQMQLLDLAISDIEEFRIGGRVDGITRTIHVEPEVIGSKGGRLAKFFNHGKGANSLFSSQPTEDAVFAAAMSLPLPPKDWKPTADALYAFAQSQGKTASADVVRAFAKTIESGQFELYTYNPSWNQGLIALRLNGGAGFPEQLQGILREISDPPPFEFAVDFVEGVPIHRTLTTLDSSPVFSMLATSFMALFGQQYGLPDFNEPNEEREITVPHVFEGDGADGKRRTVTKLVKTKMPAAANCLWLAATPRAIWLGFGPAKSDCPGWFKTQIAASLAAPSSGRSKSPFQVTLRGLGTTPESEIQQVANEERVGVDFEVDPRTAAQGSVTLPSPQISAEVIQRQAEQLKAREALLRDLPNTIHCEFRPTETGAKLTVTLEDAYFQWFAAMIRDQIEMNEVMKQHPPQGIDLKPAQ
ncbi:MAG: hypothetical protein JWP89_4557 [Schlesneria sp.]|nr:hypothetical protein [Schlesneria sp.]